MYDKHRRVNSIEQQPPSSTVEIIDFEDESRLISDSDERKANRRAAEEETKNWNIVSLVLSICILSLIIAFFMTKNDEAKHTMLIISCFIGIVYLGEVYWSDTFKYMWYANTTDSAIDSLENLRRVAPCISCCVQSYHFKEQYAESTRTMSAGVRETNVSSQEVRINTHKAVAEFEFKKWRDQSESVYTVARPFDIIRLHIEIKVLMGDLHTEQMYRKMGQDLVTANSGRDSNYEFIELHTIPGLNPKMLLFPGDETRKKPFWMSWYAYVFSVLTLSNWPYRIAIEMQTVKVIYDLVKVVYA